MPGPLVSNPSARSDRLTISAIVPVHNGGENFRGCLLSLAQTSPPPDEIIVVTDGDTDGSWRVAEEFGVQVIRLPSQSGGPAMPRNVGAHRASGDLLFFIDADVTIPPDAFSQGVEAFKRDPDLAALFGSYDDAPAATNFLNQYKNLLHHYVHQTAREEASTFWGACGTIRRPFMAIMTALRYIEWNDLESGSPAILRKGDFGKLLSSPKLFARKFDIHVDVQVLDLIDEKLLSEKTGQAVMK
jgi:glycosyltransferase involved in cell wall biosynthesis